MVPHVLVMVERTKEVFEVVPPRHVQARHIDLVVTVVVTQSLPKLIEGVVAAHEVPVRSSPVDDIADGFHRERPEDLVPIRVFERVGLLDPSPGGKAPPGEIELKDTVRIRDLLLPAPSRRGRDHGPKVRWSLRRPGPLHPTHVAEPGGPDVAVAPRLDGHPLDDIAGVLGVVGKCDPFTLGLTPPPDVDGDEHIAIVLVKRRVIRHEGDVVLPVRRQFYDGGYAVRRQVRREVNVGRQLERHPAWGYRSRLPAGRPAAPPGRSSL